VQLLAICADIDLLEPSALLFLSSGVFPDFAKNARIDQVFARSVIEKATCRFDLG